jgi:hypothetical protein
MRAAAIATALAFCTTPLPQPSASRPALLRIRGSVPQLLSAPTGGNQQQQQQPTKRSAAAVVAKPPEAAVTPPEADWGGLPAAISASNAAALNSKLVKSEDAETILSLVSKNAKQLNPVNAATALHRIASHLKKARATRDRVLRDARFLALLDAAADRAASCNPRSVSDMLWAFATLQHWPPSMLKPLLTRVAFHLEANAFEAQHLALIVWAFAVLELKPTVLLARIEEVQRAPAPLTGGCGGGAFTFSERTCPDAHRPPPSPLPSPLRVREQCAISQLKSFNGQNCANLLWGFAKLNYKPEKLLPQITAKMAESRFLERMKPVEIADASFALAVLGSKEHQGDLMAQFARRATPDDLLGSFSSRQLVTLTWAYARMALKPAPLEMWVERIREQHERQPLLAQDQRNMKAALARLEIDTEWLQPPVDSEWVRPPSKPEEEEAAADA